MIDNKTHILEIFDNLKGQFIINGTLVERLIAVGTDEFDYYWVTYNGRKLRWSTCCGNIIPLKGYIKNKDYNDFISLAKLNHGDKTSLWFKKDDETSEEAKEKHKKEITTLKGEDKFLTDVCWDLN